jgi:hypothetical protein
MKRVIYALILPLVVVSGLVFANREKSSPKPSSIADRQAGLEDMKKWEDSSEGKKVHASGDKIMKYIKSSTNMDAVITSFSLPSRTGEGTSALRGVMVRINGEAYLLNFGPMRSNEDVQSLLSLKVNDKIVVRGHITRYSINYAYFIISADYVERDSKILFNRNFNNGGRNVNNGGC